MRTFIQHLNEAAYQEKGRDIASKIPFGANPKTLIFKALKKNTIKFQQAGKLKEAAESPFVRATKTDVHYTGQINGKTYVVPHAFYDSNDSRTITPMRHSIVVSPTHVQHNNPTLTPEESLRVHSHIKDIHQLQDLDEHAVMMSHAPFTGNLEKARHSALMSKGWTSGGEGTFTHPNHPGHKIHVDELQWEHTDEHGKPVGGSQHASPTLQRHLSHISPRLEEHMKTLQEWGRTRPQIRSVKNDDVFAHHKTKIAKATLRMHDAGVNIMGGMNKDEARAHLKSQGWSDAKIHQHEHGSLNEEVHAYNVHLGGKHIDKVFYSHHVDPEEVKKSLVNHDNYDPGIRVSKEQKTRKSLHEHGKAALAEGGSYTFHDLGEKGAGFIKNAPKEKPKKSLGDMVEKAAKKKPTDHAWLHKLFPKTKENPEGFSESVLSEVTLNEINLGIGDHRVIKAFLNKQPLSSKKLSTNGKQLDGNWLGGNYIAHHGDKGVHLHDLGGTSALQVHRAIKKHLSPDSPSDVPLLKTHLDEALLGEEIAYKYGHELHPDDQKHVLAAYVHRYTGEHKPQWANKKRPDGSDYKPQHKNDADWLKHTEFAVKKNGRLHQGVGSCRSTPSLPMSEAVQYGGVGGSRERSIPTYMPADEKRPYHVEHHEGKYHVWHSGTERTHSTHDTEAAAKADAKKRNDEHVAALQEGADGAQTGYAAMNTKRRMGFCDKCAKNTSLHWSSDKCDKCHKPSDDLRPRKMEEGVEHHEALADHTKNPYHKVLMSHGFVHHSTTHEPNRLAPSPENDATVHRYVHPGHGKSHVIITQYHTNSGAYGKQGAYNAYWLHRHEQTNGIMAPSHGETKPQLDRSLSREYGPGLKKEDVMHESTLTPAESEKKEEIVHGMKKKIQGFKERYGTRAKNVMYATATKNAQELAESNPQDRSGSMFKGGYEHDLQNSVDYHAWGHVTHADNKAAKDARDAKAKEWKAQGHRVTKHMSTNQIFDPEGVSAVGHVYVARKHKPLAESALLEGKLEWSMYAGGTSAAQGKHGWSAHPAHGNYHIQPVSSATGRHRGYLLNYENMTGAIPGGGLHHQLGLFGHPNQAKGAAIAHSEKMKSNQLNEGPQLKTITSHSGLARWYHNEASPEPVGYIARHHMEHIPSPYAYSPTHIVHGYKGKNVIVKETRHKRYEVHEVPKHVTIHPTDEKALGEFVAHQKSQKPLSEEKKYDIFHKGKYHVSTTRSNSAQEATDKYLKAYPEHKREDVRAFRDTKHLREAPLHMPLKGHPYHHHSDEQLRYIAKDAEEARKNMQGFDPKAEGKYADQVNDAHTVLGYRQRGGKQAPEKKNLDHPVYTDSHIGAPKKWGGFSSLKEGIKALVHEATDSKSFWRTYHRNENANRHTLNTLHLAKHVGTPEEVATATKHLADLKKAGHNVNYKENSDLHIRLLDRMREKQGIPVIHPAHEE